MPSVMRINYSWYQNVFNLKENNEYSTALRGMKGINFEMKVDNKNNNFVYRYVLPFVISMGKKFVK